MSRSTQFRFRLFVAGSTLNSVQAQANLAKLCRTYLPERCNIQVVDVFREPELALAEGIFMTPTLVKLAPGPTLRIVGTLSQTASVLRALGLDAAAS